MKVAIFQDPAFGREPSWSERFRARVEASGGEALLFSQPGRRALDQIAGCDGLMWRLTYGPASQRVAKPLLDAVELGWKKPVWPNAATRWHYDDKAGQAWLLHGLADLVPPTVVLTQRDEALAWAASARYPQVFKMRGGSRGRAVCRVGSAEQAQRLIDRAFSRGLNASQDMQRIADGESGSWLARLGSLPQNLLREALDTFRYGRSHLYEPRVPVRWLSEAGILVFQEFLPGNDHDCKVIVVGDRACAYRRLIPAGDWRASGSEQRSYEPEAIDLGAVRIAFEVSERFGFQSMGYDFIRNPDGRLQIIEISFMFSSALAHGCPGYWDRNLAWHPESPWPQDWVAEQFLAELQARCETERVA